MRNNWTRNNGTVEKIAEMQENHLANAYAKCIREGVKRECRPALAAEIISRGVDDLVPDFAKMFLNHDANLSHRLRY